MDSSFAEQAGGVIRSTQKVETCPEFRLSTPVFWPTLASACRNCLRAPGDAPTGPPRTKLDFLSISFSFCLPPFFLAGRQLFSLIDECCSERKNLSGQRRQEPRPKTREKLESCCARHQAALAALATRPAGALLAGHRTAPLPQLSRAQRRSSVR